MIGFLLAALSPFGAIGSTSMPPELRATMNAVLKCAAAKNLRCLSRYSEHPAALRATFPNGKRGWNPSLKEYGIFSSGGVTLYTAATRPKEITYRVYGGDSHYDIVFYKTGTLPPKATWEQAGRFTPSVHCEFERTRRAWRLTDTICGYVDSD